MIKFLFFYLFSGVASSNVKDLTGHPQSFIFGGTEVTPHSIPYQVSLFTTYVENVTGQCGGSIISQYYILTAKHCVHQ
jgi:secreted trypsin-like serine protease